MTYIYRVLKEAPNGLWSMDALPINDSSGYGKNATYTGSPTTTRPIVAGGIAAQLLDSGDAVSYPIANVAVAGRETRPFTFEAWVKPSAAGNHTILARNNSGLFIDGLKLRMSMDFEDGTVVSAEYKKLRAGNVYHVVGVYDVEGISLFVNGAEVAGVNIDYTTRAFGIADTLATLSSSTTGTLVLDSVAVYYYPLSGETIRAHYEFGSDYPEVINLSTLNGGKYYEFVDTQVSTYRKNKFPATDDWHAGLLEGSVAIVDDSLVNLYDVTSDQYQSGTWTFQESFEIASGTVLAASRITWSSTAAIVVEKSEDGGTTWNALTNNSQVVTNKDLSTEGYSVSIRVTIPASAEQIVVDELVVAFYSSLNVRGSDEDLPAVVRDPASTTVAETSFPAASFNDNAGINLAGASGGLSIAGDTEFGGYFAVEMTVKLSANSTNATIMWVDAASAQPQIATDATGQWVFSNLTALYVNGAAVTSPAAISPGVWHHVMAVFPESLATVYVGNNVAGTAAHAMRIGHLATYSDPVSATDALAIYNAWVGAPSQVIDETDSLSVYEFGNPPIEQPPTDVCPNGMINWLILTTTPYIDPTYHGYRFEAQFSLNANHQWRIHIVTGTGPSDAIVQTFEPIWDKGTWTGDHYVLDYSNSPRLSNMTNQRVLGVVVQHDQSPILDPVPGLNDPANCHHWFGEKLLDREDNKDVPSGGIDGSGLPEPPADQKWFKSYTFDWAIVSGG
ncbi:hypothetical protein PP459_gp223 [Streptomyces phage Wakanda]|uniref:LamG-like jellyroll fold domain-containing protein n=1 Tax=Streptomyces phage Wakanda TaxID=2713267 RepID=A0A6G8R1G6_9CAUD|nr:hypothetical protein PP459_gp223 [Streptomyces phage Wakanda]QIN94011.1 hypothetical protein SEA_WAKANDA_18 [Streptomyces phage Wakanda]